MPFLRPPELLVLVLKYVHKEDPHTIHSCALVSRTWWLHSRPHIFQYIKITVSKHDAERWLERLIEWETQNLIPLIHHVVIHGQKSLEAPQHIPHWEIDVAEELGRRLTHATSLTVYRFFRGDGEDSFILDLEPHFAFLKHLGSATGGVRRLRLNQVHFARPDQLFHYLANVPRHPTELSLNATGHLRNLSLIEYDDSGYSNITSVPPSSRWQLTSLNLNISELRKDVILWLLSPTIDITCLQSLAIDGSSREKVIPDVSFFEKLVVAIGPTIRKFTFETTNRFTAEMLKQFTALDQLSLVSNSYPGVSYAVSRALYILPGLDGNTSLTEIILTW